MIVRTLDEVLGTRRDVGGPGWRSRRLILRADGMGCSVHDTIVAEGTEQHLHYKNHLETNYCIAGEGEVFGLVTLGVFTCQGHRTSRPRVTHIQRLSGFAQPRLTP